MKIYKIDDSKISEYSKRNNKKLFKMIIFGAIAAFMPVFLITQLEGSSGELTYIMLFSFLIMAIFIGIVFINNIRFAQIAAENLQIIVDDSSITRIINLDNELRLNFLHKIGYKKAKNTYGGFYEKIDFDSIKSIEKKDGDLWIKAPNATVLGKNMVLVPKELKDFDEVEREINSRLKVI